MENSEKILEMVKEATDALNRKDENAVRFILGEIESLAKKREKEDH